MSARETGGLLPRGRKYLSLFRIRFINTLQYRLPAAAGMATQAAWGIMRVLLFHAFYRADPAAFPMTFSQTATYIWLEQAMLHLFMLWAWDQNILDAIMSGTVSYEMIRPIDLYDKWFTDCMASRTAKAAMRFLPIILLACLLPEPYRLQPPASFSAFLLFLLTSFAGLLVAVSISMIVYPLCFLTVSGVGLRRLLVVLTDLWTGSIIPLPFFPDGVRRVAELLPFASIHNLPLRIYSGNIAGKEALFFTLLQFFWLVCLIATGKLLMRKTTRRAVIQGG